jgi:hypothetical protein
MAVVVLVLRAADRPAGTITPVGSPVWIDPFRATLFDTPAVSVSVSNRHATPVTFTLRVWIFDQGGNLRGTSSYCVDTPLDRTMRGIYYVPLEIRGVTARDRGVISVESAMAARVLWTLHETPEEQLAAAREEMRGSGGQLSLDHRDGPSQLPALCPCDCEAARAMCEQACGRNALAAFTCPPSAGLGCSSSCSCK